jgi:hypothetical protein
MVARDCAVACGFCFVFEAEERLLEAFLAFDFVDFDEVLARDWD